MTNESSAHIRKLQDALLAGKIDESTYERLKSDVTGQNENTDVRSPAAEQSQSESTDDDFSHDTLSPKELWAARTLYFESNEQREKEGWITSAAYLVALAVSVVAGFSLWTSFGWLTLIACALLLVAISFVARRLLAAVFGVRLLTSAENELLLFYMKDLASRMQSTDEEVKSRAMKESMTPPSEGPSQ